MLKSGGGGIFYLPGKHCKFWGKVRQPNGPAEVQCEHFGPVSGLNFGR